MNSKRSYLDTLNAGRQRRPHTSLEQINRSLESLEQRLERTREERVGYGGDQPRRPEPRYAKADPYAQPYPGASPQQRASAAYGTASYRQPAGQGTSAAHTGSQPRPHSYRTIASDLDRVRGQEDGVVAVGKIAEELRSLRDELRDQMSGELHREFETLRHDIHRAFSAAPAAKDSAELGLEFERLSGAKQGGQLLRELHEALAREGLRLQQRAPGAAGATALAGGARFDRQVALLLQAARDLGAVGGLHLPVEHLAARIQRLVAEQRHRLRRPR